MSRQLVPILLFLAALAGCQGSQRHGSSQTTPRVGGAALAQRGAPTPATAGPVQPMFNRIPLRAARRIVTYRHGQPQRITELGLQLPLPDPRPCAVAAAPIRQHE